MNIKLSYFKGKVEATIAAIAIKCLKANGLSEVPPKTDQSTSLLPLASLPLINNLSN
jgi:hypothetical protein